MKEWKSKAFIDHAELAMFLNENPVAPDFHIVALDGSSLDLFYLFYRLEVGHKAA